MSSSSLVQLVLSTLGCTQRELANRMHVSPAQISKWKNGEHMSFEMKEKLQELAGVGEIDADFVALAGSTEDAKKWIALLRFLAEIAEGDAETGYETAPLTEDINEDSSPLFWQTFSVLQDMGIEIPKSFPKELDVDFYADESDSIFDHQVVALIASLFRALTNVYGFYAAFASALVYDDELELFDSPAWELEYDMISLAATKLDLDSKVAPKFRQFKRTVETDVSEKLIFLKGQAFRARIPLRAELLDLIHESHEALGYAADEESLGFNSLRLHPDIYMNELLTGMRVIHQVLPAIMNKLGIEEEFQLDTSALHLGKSS